MIEILNNIILTLNINGEDREVIAKPSDFLLYTLRNEFGLTSAKPGCENGDCGACTVLIDNWPIKSCLMLTVELMKSHLIKQVLQDESCKTLRDFINKNVISFIDVDDPGILMDIDFMEDYEKIIHFLKP